MQLEMHLQAQTAALPSSRPLLPQAYRPAHHLPVYAVRWNALHSSAFLSAGADWRVKLWDSLQPKVRAGEERMPWRPGQGSGSSAACLRQHPRAQRPASPRPCPLLCAPPSPC